MSDENLVRPKLPESLVTRIEAAGYKNRSESVAAGIERLLDHVEKCDEGED